VQVVKSNSINRLAVTIGSKKFSKIISKFG